MDSLKGGTDRTEGLLGGDTQTEVRGDTEPEVREEISVW